MRFLPAAALISLAACAPAVDQSAGRMLADEPGGDSQAIHQVCPAGETTYGIDVSKWQGNINWAQVAGDGVQFAIIRVSDGTGYIDEKFAQNWQGAKDQGLTRGVYQFFRSDEDPIEQANILIERMGALEPGDLPPVVDVESTDGVSNATRVERLQQWLDHVEAAVGRRPMIYTGGYFWQDNVGADFSEYPLWHAGYTGGTCPSTVANQWPDWKFWQFSSTGSVAGIAGNVDENRFNGSLQELLDFANHNVAPRGWLDGVSCDGGATGWAQDQDEPETPIAVHLYLDGEAGSGAQGYPLIADRARDDLCSAIGSCAHGFVWPIPDALKDGAEHTLYAYGIDTAGGNNPQLSGSGLSFTCVPPEEPAEGEGEGEPAEGEGEGEGEGGAEGEGEEDADRRLVMLMPPEDSCAAAPTTTTLGACALALLLRRRRRAPRPWQVG